MAKVLHENVTIWRYLILLLQFNIFNKIFNRNVLILLLKSRDRSYRTRNVLYNTPVRKLLSLRAKPAAESNARAMPPDDSQRAVWRENFWRMVTPSLIIVWTSAMLGSCQLVLPAVEFQQLVSYLVSWRLFRPTCCSSTEDCSQQDMCHRYTCSIFMHQVALDGWVKIRGCDDVCGWTDCRPLHYTSQCMHWQN